MALYAFAISLLMAFSFVDGASAAKLVGPVPVAQTQSSSAEPASKQEVIDLNSASEKQLDALPGVGPATAKKIIKERPYQSKDELRRKHIVSDRVYAQIKDRIVAHQSGG